LVEFTKANGRFFTVWRYVLTTHVDSGFKQHPLRIFLS
jgi:hypothetical protein